MTLEKRSGLGRRDHGGVLASFLRAAAVAEVHEDNRIFNAA
jgi:hypothetical protein